MSKTEMTDRESKKRGELKDRKPLVYEKIIRHPEKIARKESVAMIQLQYNYGCNFRCDHCAIERFRQNKGKALTVADVKRIADQADAMGLASICISGGEPLTFPDLGDVIRAIGSERFIVSLDTNGWLLNEEKIKWLIAMGVDRVHLSIDGLKLNHDEFRHAEGSWDKAVNALPLCKEHGLGVIINITVTQSMISSGELVRHLDFVAQHGYGHHVSMIYAKRIGSFEGRDDEILDSRGLVYLQELTKKYNASTHLSSNQGHHFGCLCFKKHFAITAYGDVLPCPWIPIKIGNLHEEDLSTIVNRGLGIKWFSYDHKQNCLCGNKDSFFYKNILPQVDNASSYPVDWREINWF